MFTSDRALTAALFCFALTGCGGGGDTAVNPDQEVKGVFDGYSGNFSFEGEGGGGEGVGGGGDGDGGVGAGGSLGQFKGVEAVVFLEDGSELGRTIINGDSGLFTIKPGRSYQGTLLIELRGRAGGKYYDEAKKAFVEFGPGQILRARADRANRNIGVTPLTNAAAAYMDANPGVGGSTLADRIKSANQIVGTAMTNRLPAGYKVEDVLLLPSIIGPSSGAGSAPDSDAGTYAVVLASLAEMAASFNSSLSAPALSISESLAKDFTDGIIDDKQKDGNSVAPAGQESYSNAEFDGQLNSAISRSESEFGEPNNTRDNANTSKTITLLDESLSSIRQVVQVFDDSNIEGPGPGTSTGGASNQLTGGNPGAHIATSMNLFAGDLIAVGGIKDNYTYTPSIEGPIDSIAFKVDAKMVSAGSAGMVLAIEQGGQVFYDTDGPGFTGDWSVVSRSGLKAASFSTFGTENIGNPDFTGSAPPMKFGFVVANLISGSNVSNGSGPFSLSHQVDNFELTITKP